MLEFFGIGVGDIEVTLERFAFCPGDEVRGEVRLRLRTPQEARAIVVGVRARQRVVDRYRRARDPVLSYRTDTVWEFTRELAGAGTYHEERFPFAIVLPHDVLRRPAAAPPGLLGDVARALVFLGGEKRFPLQWQVRAAVRRPFKVDVRKAVDIVVTEPRAETAP